VKQKFDFRNWILSSFTKGNLYFVTLLPLLLPPPLFLPLFLLLLLLLLPLPLRACQLTAPIAQQPLAYCAALIFRSAQPQ